MPFRRVRIRPGATPSSTSSRRSRSEVATTGLPDQDRPADRRIERPLDGKDRTRGRIMPQGSSRYGTPRTEGNRCGHRPDGIAVTQDVDDVGPGDRRADPPKRPRDRRSAHTADDRKPFTISLPAPTSRAATPRVRSASRSARAWSTGPPNSRAREGSVRRTRKPSPLTCRGRKRMRDRRGPTRSDRRRRRKRSASSPWRAPLDPCDFGASRP